jgi:hypothetical protein
MSDLKTSLLINRQVPEFIRDEYPLFISFLEAYYEYLDSQNSVYGKGKDLRYITDVDSSLDEFEKNFFNSFLPFIPLDAKLSKDILIKNILPLYLSKGSESSYKLLFRMLFNDSASVDSLSDNILRASDGRWTKEQILRVEPTVYSEYISDGTKKVYYVPYETNADNLSIYVNDVLTNDYYYQKEYRRVVFNESPASNTTIKIYYDNFIISFIENRKITGRLSSAFSIIENTAKRNVGGLTFFQLFLNEKNTTGSFINGEFLTTSIIDDTDNEIPLTLQAYSDIQKITITDGGSSYNVGDPVIILGTSTTKALAIVDEVASGVVEELNVLSGGVGFKLNNQIQANGYSNTFFSAVVDIVDSTGITTPNTVNVNIDIISDYANVNISDLDYGFPGALTENANSIISESLTYETISDLGIITSTNVQVSLVTSSEPLDLRIFSTQISNTSLRLKDLDIIGKINVTSSGSDYSVGDRLIFTNVPPHFSGQGANAFVSAVTAGTNGISKITIVDGGLGYNIAHPPLITVSSANGSNAILNVSLLMATGESFESVPAENPAGEILRIKILESGSGYRITPGIDLSQSGDGTAKAYANLTASVQDIPGRWKSLDGIISSEEIRLQGRDYYLDYAYVLSSQTEFKRYKTLLKDLLHPSGLINYARYKIAVLANSNLQGMVNSTITKTVAGTVNINSSIYIIGTNTYFEDANAVGIIGPGTQIAINDETRTINSILSNTVMTIDRGPITSIEIANSGNGYTNGFIVFSSTDTDNVAANAAFTTNSTGSIVKVVLNTGGSYADVPTGTPSTNGNNATFTVYGGGQFNTNSNNKIIKIV